MGSKAALEWLDVDGVWSSCTARGRLDVDGGGGRSWSIGDGGGALERLDGEGEGDGGGGVWGGSGCRVKRRVWGASVHYSTRALQRCLGPSLGIGGLNREVAASFYWPKR